MDGAVLCTERQTGTNDWMKGFLSARFSGELLHSCKECFMGSIPMSGLRPGALDAKPLLAAIIGADKLGSWPKGEADACKASL